MTESYSHSRNRGSRPNGIPGASRNHSKNRKWVADGFGSGSRGSDGERLERGEHRRPSGAGRVRHSSHSHSPSEHSGPSTRDYEHTANATDDERRGEDEVPEEEHVVPEPQTQTTEEREKFFEELSRARELERKRAIAEGKMDDPMVAKRLDEAITIVGTCMDMCPKFERYRRERENNLDKWEVISGTKRVDHSRAVKIYERGAGDKIIPSDIRPPPVLKKTLDYLFHDLLPLGGFLETHDFIRDRSRAVRNDFTLQHDKGPVSIECHDRCARYHILALHMERDNPKFSFALEEQQLMNTLQTLKECYEDQRGRYQSPTELEMRVYHRLIHIRDQRERHEEIPQEITSHPVFQYTTQFRLHVQNKSSPITKTSTLVVDAQAMQIFGQLVACLREANNIVMIFLVACILERLFGKDTMEDIETIRGNLSLQDIIDGISKPLPQGVDVPIAPASSGEAIGSAAPSTSGSVIFGSTASASKRQFVSGGAPATSASATFSGASQPSFSSSVGNVLVSQPPVKSAFSNLVTQPNAFGNAFGGAVFGASIPKSTFVTSAFPPVITSTNLASAPQVATTTTGASSLPPATTPESTISGGPVKSAFPPASFLPSSSSAPYTSVDESSFAASTVKSTKIFGGPLFKPSTKVPSTAVPTAASQPSDAQALNPLAPTFTLSNIPSTPPTPLAPSAITQSAVPTFATATTPQPVSPLNAPPPEVSGRPSHPSVAASSVSLSLPTPSFFVPPVAPQTASTSAGGSVPATPKIIERHQTLFDIPSSASHPARPPTVHTALTPAPLTPTADAAPGITLAPRAPKAKQLPLPPTPTTRWFESAVSEEPAETTPSRELPARTLGLARYGSGMLSPLFPPSEVTWAVEHEDSFTSQPPPSPPPSVVSPASSFVIAQGSTSRSTQPPHQVVSPPSSVLASSSTAKVAQPTSKSQIRATGHTAARGKGKDRKIPPKDKGKGREILAEEEDSDEEIRQVKPEVLDIRDALVRERNLLLLEAVIDRWRKKRLIIGLCKKTMKSGEDYVTKLARERLSLSQSFMSTKNVEDNKARASVVGSPFKRAKRRVPWRYQPRLTDEELGQRLKQNYEEQQRRWARGSLLKIVRSHLKTMSRGGAPPPDWRLWLSMNPENDRTAIWLEHKFDVPDSGTWDSENVFSIPGTPSGQDPPSRGSPGLIVFERTPLAGITDELERKILNLDDCARLREVISNFPQKHELRFVPSLLVIVWTAEETSKTKEIRDFEDMTAKLVDDGVIKSLSTFSIASTSSKLDDSFAELMANVPLDTRDNSFPSMSWNEIIREFFDLLKTLISGWVNGCRIDGIFDSTAYQSVLRDIEESLTYVTQRVIRLFGVSSEVHVNVPLELQAPPQTIYDMEPFLDRLVQHAAKVAKEQLDGHKTAGCITAKTRVDMLMSEIVTFLEARDKPYAARAFPQPARTSPKRRATDELHDDSPPPRKKRMRSSSDSTNDDVGPSSVSASPTPTPSTSVSTPDAVDVTEKPVVTVAMLRELTRNIVKTYGLKIKTKDADHEKAEAADYEQADDAGQ